jgi:hypothetical protein
VKNIQIREFHAASAVLCKKCKTMHNNEKKQLFYKHREGKVKF